MLLFDFLSVDDSDPPGLDPADELVGADEDEDGGAGARGGCVIVELEFERLVEAERGERVMLYTPHNVVREE